MTSPVPVSDIYVSTVNNRPVYRLSEDYSPASGRQMADDIIAALAEKTPNLVHPDAATYR